MAGILQDDYLHISPDQLNLLPQGFAQGFLSANRKHWHGQLVF